MTIKQIYDEGLAHASYVLLCNKEIMVIDPARNPKPYYDYAKEHHAKITGIIETHPHADFVSSHLEIHKKTGATIYTSKKTEATYPHQGFDEGDVIKIDSIRLKALNTPGHSPDSICVLVEDEGGKQKAVFTGDTLFVGDVGRPDLRERAAEQQDKRERFARQMYHSLREKLLPLQDEVVVYPAHGAGSLCGKGISDERTSTIGKERKENPALQSMSETEFVGWLLEDQPFIPKYFSFNVDLNKQGAPDFAESISNVSRLKFKGATLKEGVVIVDARPAEDFKKGHLKGAINIMEDGKFETWLGSIVAPKETFYLIAADEKSLESGISKAAKIGYEANIEGAIIQQNQESAIPSDELNVDKFKNNAKDYTIVDVRNKSEVKEEKIFKNAINIPLPELRNRTNEIPEDKPIVVHCASGYRSAAGSSIVEKAKKDSTKVYDLSEAVKQFMK